MEKRESISVATAARLSGFSRITIYGMCASGHLPASKDENGCWQIALSAIEPLLEYAQARDKMRQLREQAAVGA